MNLQKLSKYNLALNFYIFAKLDFCVFRFINGKAYSSENQWTAGAFPCREVYSSILPCTLQVNYTDVDFMHLLVSIPHCSSNNPSVKAENPLVGFIH